LKGTILGAIIIINSLNINKNADLYFNDEYPDWPEEESPGIPENRVVRGNVDSIIAINR